MLVSVPEELLITNDVEATIEATGADKCPTAPPGVFLETKTRDPASTADVETVTVPATRVAVPRTAELRPNLPSPPMDMRAVPPKSENRMDPPPTEPVRNSIPFEPNARFML